MKDDVTPQQLKDSEVFKILVSMDGSKFPARHISREPYENDEKLARRISGLYRDLRRELYHKGIRDYEIMLEGK